MSAIAGPGVIAGSFIATQPVGLVMLLEDLGVSVLRRFLAIALRRVHGPFLGEGFLLAFLWARAFFGRHDAKFSADAEATFLWPDKGACCDNVGRLAAGRCCGR